MVMLIMTRVYGVSGFPVRGGSQCEVGPVVRVQAPRFQLVSDVADSRVSTGWMTLVTLDLTPTSCNQLQG